MKAKDIENALKQKYSMDPNCIRGDNVGNDEWVVYEQFYSDVGGYGRKRICDFMAFKLWGEGLNIIAHEIKISKSDFKKDVENFLDKQGLFMDFSTEFYYVCPWGLIDPGEIPEGTGLMYVNKSNKVITKKQAPFRPKTIIPVGTFKSFVARQARGVNRFSLPLTYVEENITEAKFIDLMENKVKERAASEVYKKLSNYKDFELQKALKEKLESMEIYTARWLLLLEEALPPYIVHSVLRSDAAAISFASKVFKFINTGIGDYSIRSSFKAAKQLVDNLEKIKALGDDLEKEYVKKKEKKKKTKQLPLE